MQSSLCGNRTALNLAARAAASASLRNRRFAAIALRSNLLLARLPPCHCAPCSMVLSEKKHPIFTNKSSSVKEFENLHTTLLHRRQKRTSSSSLVGRRTITTDNAFCAIYATARVSARDKRAVCLYSKTYVASFWPSAGHRLLNLALNSSTVEK